jgi:hypothetical protein
VAVADVLSGLILAMGITILLGIKPMSAAIDLITSIFANPPSPYNPVNQTPKGWAMFCLRDRGFVVEMGNPKADFTIKSRSGNLACSVAETIPEAISPGVVWIVIDGDRTKAQVLVGD